MAATPDPFTSQDTRNALARRSPSFYDRLNDVAGSLIDKSQLPGMSQAAATEFGPSTVAQNVVDGPGKQYDTPASAVTPVPATTTSSASTTFNPSVADVAASQDSQRQSVGMQRLSPGVVRSSVPGVYTARMKDGSIGFSNVAGANGEPDFGALTPQEQAMTAGMNRRFSGTQVSANAEHYNPDTGMTAGPGVTGTFTRDVNAGQVDPNGLKGLPSAAATNADYTFANASGGFDTAGQIDVSTNPYQIQAAQRDLAAAIEKDPNASNPEVAAANRVAMQRLSGAYLDKAHQFYGEPGLQSAAMMGDMGVPGLLGTSMGAGRGNIGVTLKDIGQVHTDQQNADTNEAKAHADALIAAQNANETARNHLVQNMSDQEKARVDALGVPLGDYALYQQLGQQGTLDPSVQSAAQQKFDTYAQQLLASGLAESRGYMHNLNGSDAPPSYDTPLSQYALQSGSHGGLTVVGPNGLTSDVTGYGADDQLGHMAAVLGVNNYSPKLVAAFNDPVLRPLLLQAIAKQQSGMQRSAARGQ